MSNILEKSYRDFELACEIGYSDIAIQKLEKYLDERNSYGHKDSFSLEELTQICVCYKDHIQHDKKALQAITGNFAYGALNEKFKMPLYNYLVKVLTSFL